MCVSTSSRTSLSFLRHVHLSTVSICQLMRGVSSSSGADSLSCIGTHADRWRIWIASFQCARRCDLPDCLCCKTHADSRGRQTYACQNGFSNGTVGPSLICRASGKHGTGNFAMMRRSETDSRLVEKSDKGFHRHPHRTGHIALLVKCDMYCSGERIEMSASGNA